MCCIGKQKQLPESVPMLEYKSFALALTSQVPRYYHKRLCAAHKCYSDHQHTLIASDLERPKLVLIVAQNHYDLIFNYILIAR